MFIRKKSQAGFSMIELLVAVVILAVGLLGLAKLQIVSIKSNAQSDSITVANALTQKAVEDIAAMSADDAIFTSDVANATWAGSPYDIAGAGTYNVTYNVVTNFNDVNGLSEVTVKVSSASKVSNVLGNKFRTVKAVTFKRSF